jgi:hypothetical protein
MRYSLLMPLWLVTGDKVVHLAQCQFLTCIILGAEQGGLKITVEYTRPGPRAGWKGKQSVANANGMMKGEGSILRAFLPVESI